MKNAPWRMPRAEPRFDNSIPLGTVSSSDSRMVDIFNVSPTVTGRHVNESSSMQVSAVYACVRLIAGAIASLPLDIYSRDGDIRAKINEHDDLWWLLNEQPHARWTTANFWKWVIRAELLRGDGFAEILRGRGGMPVGLRPICADVMVEVQDDRLRYYWRDEWTGIARGCDQDDIIHIPGFGFDGRRGMSAISWGARNGIGIALAADEYSGRFYGSGAAIKHALRAPGKMTGPQIDALRQNWSDRYGGLDNSFKPLVLTEGLDVKELSLSAADAQLLEARKFQVIDIARAFQVPPVLIGESEKTSSWGSGVEQIVLAFVKFSLGDRLVTIEQELNRKLLRTSRRMVKFNADHLLRGDSASRAKFLRELVGGSAGPGILTPNEARMSEGLSPTADGDKRYDPQTAMQAGQAKEAPPNA